jgi:hypothetical protein
MSEPVRPIIPSHPQTLAALGASDLAASEVALLRAVATGTAPTDTDAGPLGSLFARGLLVLFVDTEVPGTRGAWSLTSAGVAALNAVDFPQ